MTDSPRITRVRPADEPCTAQRWESLTPTDDGWIIVDCPIHGEIGSIPTSGTLDKVVDGDDEAGRIAAFWASHVGGGA